MCCRGIDRDIRPALLFPRGWVLYGFQPPCQGIRRPDVKSRAVALIKSQVFPKPLEVVSGQLTLKSFYSTVAPNKVVVMNYLGFPVNPDQLSGDVQCDCCCFFAANLNNSSCVKATAIELVENNLQPFRRIAINKARAMN